MEKNYKKYVTKYISVYESLSFYNSISLVNVFLRESKLLNDKLS